MELRELPTKKQEKKTYNSYKKAQKVEERREEGIATKRHKKHKNRGESSMQFEDINKLCDVVRETSCAVHKYHRSGHLEKIYENALTHRLTKQELKVKQQYPLQ